MKLSTDWILPTLSLRPSAFAFGNGTGTARVGRVLNNPEYSNVPDSRGNNSLRAVPLGEYDVEVSHFDLGASKTPVEIATKERSWENTLISKIGYILAGQRGLTELSRRCCRD